MGRVMGFLCKLECNVALDELLPIERIGIVLDVARLGSWHDSGHPLGSNQLAILARKSFSSIA